MSYPTEDSRAGAEDPVKTLLHEWWKEYWGMRKRFNSWKALGAVQISRDSFDSAISFAAAIAAPRMTTQNRHRRPEAGVAKGGRYQLL